MSSLHPWWMKAHQWKRLLMMSVSHFIQVNDNVDKEEKDEGNEEVDLDNRDETDEGEEDVNLHDDDDDDNDENDDEDGNEDDDEDGEEN